MYNYKIMPPFSDYIIHGCSGGRGVGDGGDGDDGDGDDGDDVCV